MTEATQATGLRPMIDLLDVTNRLPFSKQSLLRMARRGDFPKAHRIGVKKLAFYLDEVEAWQRDLDRKPLLKKKLARREAGQRRQQQGGRVRRRA